MPINVRYAPFACAICRIKSLNAHEQLTQALIISDLASGKTNNYSMIYAKLSGILSRGNMPHDKAVLSR
ncbi:hypothetical protein [Methylobacter luteus]|uniref:hypothetical protein n=1 Tax=Methylobacter luteus TaxID=415 RepID=UPI0003FECEBB|nr:hypothetical protein [Methylobacter luteus]